MNLNHLLCLFEIFNCRESSTQAGGSSAITRAITGAQSSRTTTRSQRKARTTPATQTFGASNLNGREGFEEISIDEDLIDWVTQPKE